MAVCKIEGLDDYAKALEALGKDSSGVIKGAVYQGAAVVADEIKDSIGGIPVERAQWKSSKDMAVGIPASQKKGLIESFGISAYQFDSGTDFGNVKLGFDGYSGNKTKKYPKGKPNQLIARTVESGTSFLKKHPFVRPAINRTRGKCKEAMAEKVDEEIKRRFE